MNRLIVLRALFALALLTGCARGGDPYTGTSWECNGCAAQTKDQLHMDVANCELTVQQMAASQQPRAYYAPQCTADPATCQGFANLGSLVANQGPGPQQVSLCMAGKGWQQVQ